MEAPGPSNLVAMRAIDELADFSTQNSRTYIAQLNVMISEMEAIEDQDEVYDSLMCLRDDKRAKNENLMVLNELVAMAEEEINRKEVHVEIMEAAISFVCLQYGKCMDLMVFNEYETYGVNGVDVPERNVDDHVVKD
ncbi:hypothetical protein Tco_1450747 [Tanacetum coccineum]